MGARLGAENGPKSTHGWAVSTPCTIGDELEVLRELEWVGLFSPGMAVYCEFGPISRVIGPYMGRLLLFYCFLNS